MNNSDIANMLKIILIIMFFVLGTLIFVGILLKIKLKKGEIEDKKEMIDPEGVPEKTKVQQLYSTQSIFNFMEFEKIEDNMIVQNKGKKFLMIIKCQGINYDLMSGVEKNSVEQGFIQFLNALRQPIQIYVQTRTVDLGNSINTYRQKIRVLGDNLAQKEFDYNQKVRSGNYNESQLEKERFEVVRAKNLYEYGTDIVSNTERMSLNRNILSKQYYIIIPYYVEETGMANYGKDEVRNIAFSELYTRAQSMISLLSVCGINSKILDSTEIAQLLYVAYNRDEAELYDLEKAIKSGYDEMYITAPDVLEKRIKELDKQIELDAIKKANDTVLKIREEDERERIIKQKEKEHNEIVSRMAEVIIENNKDILGEKIATKAKEAIRDEQKSSKQKATQKEGKVDETKKVKRAGRPRKTA